jgi:hypothetical protein
VTALVYEASLNLTRRRLHLKLTRHAVAQLPMPESGLCQGALLESSALAAPCFSIDAIEAAWESW